MSTRYVWGKYTTETERTKVYSSGPTNIIFDSITGDGIKVSQTIYYKVFEDSGHSDSNGIWARNPIENGTISVGETVSIPISARGAVIISTSPIPDSPNNLVYKYNDITNITFISSAIRTLWTDKNVTRWYMEPRDVTIKGSYLSDVSGTSQSTYPEDGVSGNYWYEYQGSDNIDPTAVSIPSTIKGGTAITITVTPGTGKVYGGTVSYQYQVNLAGAGWTTIATTSATSYQYTVPYGTASIQVRVRAQDNIGFTSTTYVNSLTQTDTISADWGTVAYRACAVDDDGASGPYVTSETTTVNSGWVIISGPASDMGDKPAPFDFVFSVSVTGQTSVDAINVAVTLDGESIYTGTPNSGVEVSIPIDTRLLAVGEHTVEVQASKESYLEASGSYTFNVPAITLPDGGRAEMLQNPEGDVVFPYTLARLVIGKDGKDVNALIEELLRGAVKIQTGTYEGTGTYGQSNPNSLTFEFEPKLIIVHMVFGATSGVARGSLIFIWPSPYNSLCLYSEFDGTGPSVTMYPITASFSDNTVTWYSEKDAYVQGNASGLPISYTVFGQ